MSKWPATSRRSLLLSGGTALFAVQLPGCGIAASRDAAAVLPNFRRPGDRDDTAALLRAAATGRPVHAPAGRYAIAMTAADDLPGGFAFFGDGADRTIIARSYARSAPFILHADSRSARNADNLRGFRLQGLSFEDDVVTRGYSEFDYLVMLSGITGALIEDCAFRGFRGDALYLGSSTQRSVERHNASVTVRGCRFDGVNGNNRNAISVLDCDGLTIQDCEFINVGRTGGPAAFDPYDPNTGTQNPGAIDIEPEATGFARVAGVAIRGNRFSGGGGYAVTMNLFANGYDGLASGITISDNHIADRSGAFSAIAAPSRVGSPGQTIIINGNIVERCDKPFLIDRIDGLQMARNRFADCPGHAEIGWQGGTTNVAIVENQFERLGVSNGYAVWIREADGLRLEGNEFIDCGKRDGSLGIPLAFVSGTSRDVNFVGNSFVDRTGRTTEASTVFSGASIDRRSMQAHDNRLVGKIARTPAAAF